LPTPAQGRLLISQSTIGGLRSWLTIYMRAAALVHSLGEAGSSVPRAVTVSGPRLAPVATHVCKVPRSRERNSAHRAARLDVGSGPKVHGAPISAGPIKGTLLPFFCKNPAPWRSFRLMKGLVQKDMPSDAV
jgi:hypothetical protein